MPTYTQGISLLEPPKKLIMRLAIRFNRYSKQWLVQTLILLHQRDSFIQLTDESSPKQM